MVSDSNDHVILSSQYHPSVHGSILGVPGSQGGFAGLCTAVAWLRNLYSWAAPLVDPSRSFREGHVHWLLISALSCVQEKSSQSKIMWASMRSPDLHLQMMLRGSKSRLKQWVYSETNAWPTARWRALQDEEQGGLALSMATQSRWLLPSGGMRRERQ